MPESCDRPSELVLFISSWRLLCNNRVSKSRRTISSVLPGLTLQSSQQSGCNYRAGPKMRQLPFWPPSKYRQLNCWSNLHDIWYISTAF